VTDPREAARQFLADQMCAAFDSQPDDAHKPVAPIPLFAGTTTPTRPQPTCDSCLIAADAILSRVEVEQFGVIDAGTMNLTGKRITITLPLMNLEAGDWEWLMNPPNNPVRLPAQPITESGTERATDRPPPCDCGHEFEPDPDMFHLGTDCAYWRWHHPSAPKESA
jgi:hypothetical protein